MRLQDEYINYMKKGQEKYYKGIQNQLSAMELENKKYIAEIVKYQANNQIIGGDLRKQSVANIMQQMTDYGMTSFVYADSLGNMRSINLKSYAEIQIRSSIAYATNQAIVDSNEQLENDLVQFSTRVMCAKLIVKVESIRLIKIEVTILIYTIYQDLKKDIIRYTQDVDTV